MFRLSLARPSKNPAASSDVWALRPEELAAHGLGGSGQDLFGSLQRPWRWDDAGPRLSDRVRARLDALGSTLPLLESSHTSRDGSTKLLLSVAGGAVEAVHMPREVGAGRRVTLCLSSQLGCALGCAFCATARMGLTRHLSAGEIVAEVLVVLRELGPRHPSQLTLVFMGMGEPLHNLRQVARALGVLCDPRGLGLPARRITVSTAGLVPQIERLAALPDRPLLAISLNATTDPLRQELMPIARRYPLSELRAVLERYPVRARERITVEYVLLAGVNDSVEDARRLSDFCAPFPHNINLIPFNAHPHAPFAAPSEATVEAFAGALLQRRSSLVTVRRSRGQDIQAACGQLVQLQTPP
jgi:23S rRNA (adenine2503-C2)-methyltransferase